MTTTNENGPLYPERAQGDGRKAHYGDGIQPWDIILTSGWGPAFAAGHVLKYLRRDKAKVHSLESARWYYGRIIEGAAGVLKSASSVDDWCSAMNTLELTLTREERILARGGQP